MRQRHYAAQRSTPIGKRKSPQEKKHEQPYENRHLTQDSNPIATTSPQSTHVFALVNEEV